MGASEVTLECPYCNWLLKVVPPDQLHLAFSFEKPLRGSYHGEVIRQDFVCRNPECGKSFAVYWYSPTSYFDRV